MTRNLCSTATCLVLGRPLQLAHQWWGNMVTCLAFTEFRLDEGFATYMAAAYREVRFGRDVYLEEIASMNLVYHKGA